MALKITDTEMTSDITRQTARFSDDAAADGAGAWLVPWVAGRLLTQPQAVTAMTIAETVAAHADDDDAHDEFAKWRLHLDGWAAELGLTGPWAIQRAHAAELAHAAEPEPPAPAPAPAGKVPIQCIITTLPMGRKTKVNFSAHVLDEPAPYEVAAMMVPVDSRRPRDETGEYLTDLLQAIMSHLLVPHPADIVTPTLPFGVAN
jgi:hypothetical protein